MATTYLICQYHKYGHCKFGDQCLRNHVHDVCMESNCDLRECSRRHPRKCNFFYHYGRCKFGEACSYSHTLAEDSQVIENRLMALESRLKSQEDVIAVQNNELDELKSKVLLLEKENIEMKQQVSNLIDSMKVTIPKAVVDATQPVILKLTMQQTSFEKQTKRHCVTKNEIFIYDSMNLTSPTKAP